MYKIKGWIDGLGIFIAIFIIVSITSVNDYVKDKQFRQLYKQSKDKFVNVLRNNGIISMSTSQLLVGDIVEVTTGDSIEVDAILLKNNSKIYTEFILYSKILLFNS